MTPAPHGNARKKQAPGYIRTKPSVLQRVQEVAETSGPKDTFHQVSEEYGGYLGANSASDIPRNREKGKNCRARSLQSGHKSRNVDSLAILLQECKRQQMSLGTDSFIREVIGAPELRCVLGFDWQLEEIEQFCTDPLNFTIFSADPTFNLGKFNLTVTTYRHLKVITRRDGHHPIMIGPLLLSQTKTTETYDYFFGKLAALNKNLRNVLAFGTDGEEALIEGMKTAMNQAIHLRCFGHFRDNCKLKLRESNVPEQTQLQFLQEIFGKQQGETLEIGKHIISHRLFNTFLLLETCLKRRDFQPHAYLMPGLLLYNFYR